MPLGKACSGVDSSDRRPKALVRIWEEGLENLEEVNQSSEFIKPRPTHDNQGLLVWLYLLVLGTRPLGPNSYCYSSIFELEAKTLAF